MKLTKREIATVDAALAAWQHRLAEGERWIRSVYDFSSHAPLTKQEVQALRDRLKCTVPIDADPTGAEIWKMSVPTYVGNMAREQPYDGPDFAEPNVSVLVHEAEGVRVLMGTHDRENRDKPDVQIERRPHGWAVFIHANCGDPVALIFILDDGRTFVLQERFAHPPLEIVEEIPRELDAP